MICTRLLVALTCLCIVPFSMHQPWDANLAFAQEADPATKEAFEAARTLGTLPAWEAFLARYRNGFYPDLARAYVKRLTDSGVPVAPAFASPTAPVGPALAAPASAASAAPTAPALSATASPATPAALSDPWVPPTNPAKPAVDRGQRYMGFVERFNRYYTDAGWRPSVTIYVSPEGKGDGTSRDRPTSVSAAVSAAKPGTMIHFNRGGYRTCVEFTSESSGTYDAPIVLYGERNEDQSIGVTMNCCTSGGRQTCFNLEAANYIAIDGFELVGGRYGVRAVGKGYAASEHSVGIAVLNNHIHDQNNDALFSGQSDWAVWERNRAHGAGPGDGHGLYISNGSDWNIVRFNETFNNPRSDFQVNASPLEMCKELGIAVDDPRCDAYAGEGEGGQGASDYLLVDSNYFHHNAGPGVNFTSVRRSLIRNNVFGFNGRHNVSFWQETDNPKLGSRENKILHNLFVSTGRHGVQFSAYSTRNEFANNVVIGVQPSGAANLTAVLVEVDDTVGENVYRGNFYGPGRFNEYKPNDQETVSKEFSAGWFAQFPRSLNRDPNDLRPVAGAPFLAKGAVSPNASADRNGTVRTGPFDLGPIARATAAPSVTPAVSPAPPPPARSGDASDVPAGAAPRAVSVARTKSIPACALFVDASASAGGNGSALKPYRTIALAVMAARPAAVICVAEGTYAEQIKPGEKSFTLAGGFQRGQEFKVRDSTAYVSKAQGKGGSFIRIEDPGPKGEALTAIDGFEITGYAQAIFRDYYEPQRFDITNNYIHDNTCTDQKLVGAAFALSNVSGTIKGNVILRNACGRGGGGSVYDALNKSTVLVANNLVDGNSGTEPDASHGGGLYLFANKLTVTGNLFVNNRVTQWGGGLYVGAWTSGGIFTNAKMSWNVYRGNRAGNSGGGFFCDDAASCVSEHEIYAENCGGNILLDGGDDDSGPSSATFNHITNVGALDIDCKSPGIGVLVTKGTKPAMNYSFSNALFWGNAAGKDFATYCDQFCTNAKISISHSMVQTEHAKEKMSAVFGAGIVPPADPLFVDPKAGDYHLRSTAGKWTKSGYVPDQLSSPALAKGTGPTTEHPARSGKRNEVGTYGNSSEAAYVE